MSANVDKRRTVELEDIQGLVRFGYKHLHDACFLLLRIRDPIAARAWLAQVQVTTAIDADPLPQTALQIAVTSAGLEALGVPPNLREAFSSEFVGGMASDAARARRLGDLEASDPALWQWGVGERVPHVAVLLYAARGGLVDWRRQVEEQYAAGFTQLACLSTSEEQSVEPFGFADGISQPLLDWQRQRPVRDQDQLDYSNLSCLGEFLLGYPNEYGLYTPRPLIAPGNEAAMALPRAEDAPDLADLGRNGTYLVIRQLRQDVQGFWDELDRQAGGDQGEREWLAASMVGRTKSGEPLVEQGAAGAGSPESTSARNSFTYASDPRGVRCPLGAHIRRVNPRNADLPPGPSGLLSRLWRMLGLDSAARDRDLVASTRFHRLLRRGRSYGPGEAVPEAHEGLAPDMGLHFICLASDIKRQFEFVQSAWIMGSRFAGLHGERDPLLGHRRPDAGDIPADGFAVPQADGPDRRLHGLPQFVTVVGGAYFFLPGVRALRYLATAR